MGDLNDKHILVVGLGNMATALISGLLRSAVVNPLNVTAVVHGLKSQQNAELLGVNTVSGVEALEKPVDIVLLAVKPQVMADVLPLCKGLVCADTLFISIAAGVSIERLTDALGKKASIIRAMPNTPVAVGEGMAAIYAPSHVSDLHQKWADSIFSASGACLFVPKEGQMHAVTALSGSGPAYFFYFIEALAEAGVAAGLSKTDSYKLAIGTCKGAGVYANACFPAKSIEELRENVTSKGGTTAAGLAVLKASNLKGICSQVVDKAIKVSISLDM